MKIRLARVVVSSAVVLGAIVASGWMSGRDVQANDDNGNSKSEIGLSITPVPLNLKGKDPAVVGYGSYLVNAVADCNGCHTKGPATEYLPTGNPYTGAKKIRVNPETYLGGGQSFGTLIPGSAEIISRNLTPDKTGRPEGGHTFQEFLEIMRRGVDFDHLHPTCSSAPNANCIPKPFDGSLLQIMPWPAFSHMTEGDLWAIYEYLSAIPCIAGPPSPSNLHNDCQ